MSQATMERRVRRIWQAYGPPRPPDAWTMNALAERLTPGSAMNSAAPGDDLSVPGRGLSEIRRYFAIGVRLPADPPPRPVWMSVLIEFRERFALALAAVVAVVIWRRR